MSSLDDGDEPDLADVEALGGDEVRGTARLDPMPGALLGGIVGRGRAGHSEHGQASCLPPCYYLIPTFRQTRACIAPRYLLSLYV